MRAFFCAGVSTDAGPVRFEKENISVNYMRKSNARIEGKILNALLLQYSYICNLNSQRTRVVLKKECVEMSTILKELLQ